MPPGLEIEQRDGVRVVHMKFGRANAMNREMLDGLAATLHEGERQPTVLTGEGKIFCAGLDLVTLDALGREDFEEFLTRFSRTMVQVLTTPYPLVAAVNGHAVAGGCVLALACDYRVGAQGDYKIGMNELSHGLPLPAVASEIPRGALTPQTYRTVIMSGVLMPPETAQQVGILDMISEDVDTAVEQACALAREQGKYPEAFAGVKSGVVAPVVNAIKELREPLDRRFVDIWFADETAAARRATVAKLTGKG
ncbi:MAG: enoyl-CoA hydratase/isomerase family protein [Acidobacteriota bacterium]|jgi:enoyl-CoA hydratase